MEGSAHNVRGQNGYTYAGADMGRDGGGTYTQHSTEPTIQDYENIFGPSARDIKTDLQRFKRHGRWHLPDVLKGPNTFLTDRVDGLITDATNSPFTTRILPYKYIANPDAKLKWNVWSFDEGMASRVPYESAARVLTQTKRSFAGYMVRQGMAIVLEHNFMMSDKGRENFRNQLQQMVGSIQYTNDLDVHVALVLAPSYQKQMRERYFIDDKTPTQVCREFVDLFGFMQKNQNALDILIEEGKAQLKNWGGPVPDFLLCNSKLTFQLTMTPEKTSYVTQGIDGVKRLRAGPDLTSYRGLNIIHSRCFSMEPGTPPRDILRRRVRVAEYYRILPSSKNANREFQFYNEERDTWFTYSFLELLEMASYTPNAAAGYHPHDRTNHTRIRDTINVLRNLNSALVKKEGPHLGAEPGHSETAQLGNELHIEQPARLGATFLGFNADGVDDSSRRQLLGKVIEAALDSTYPNWAPQGNFITEDLIFAVGAVDWNKFYKSVGGVNSYIPPEKYYFPAWPDTNDAEIVNAIPFGLDDCKLYRNTLTLSNDTRLRDYYALATGSYVYSSAAGVHYQVAANQAEVESQQEQAKVTLSLLFEAVCEYPRNMSRYYENPSSQQHWIAPLDASFLLGSANDPFFANSVRFRNYMRYAIDRGLINLDRVDAAGNQANLPEALTAITSGNILCNIGAKTYMPWNKINNTCNGVIKYQVACSPVNYSAFNISKGARTSNVYNHLNFLGPLPAVLPNDSLSSTMFSGNDRDNGRAILREPGAFLMPNHFHSNNDAFDYESIGSFIGANIILTNEMINALLKYPNGHRSSNEEPFLQNTFFHSLLQKDNPMPTEFVDRLYILIQECWQYLNPTPAAPANFTRLNITSRFIDLANAERNLSNIFDVASIRRNFTDVNTRADKVWTWSHVQNTDDEVMCQPATDYRLQEVTAAAPGVPTPLALGTVAPYFVHYQVGNGAILNWATNHAIFTGAAGATPGPAANHFNNLWAFSKAISSRPKDPRTNQQCELGDKISEVKAFLFQIYSRFMFDQSEPPYIHKGTQQHYHITKVVKAPYRLPKKNSPKFEGLPGGMYNGRLGNIAPQEGGPRSSMPNAWPGPGGPRNQGGPGWPGGPPWPGGIPGDNWWPGGGGGPGRHVIPDIENIEIVVVRPNIEHNMLGVIMGKGGEELGNTLWGQTELSCYDDSMHGIWGMSYKYHERAIVFNEKNLVRLWDIAYDGYCGGKDATFVNWDVPESVNRFKQDSRDVSKNYTGPSMIVMAFFHNKNSPEHHHFKRNWPSPIVFHDKYNYNPAMAHDQTQAPMNGDYTLTADPSNIHVLNYSEMRVFNNPLYSAYEHYRRHMPDFTSLHASRKPAGPSATDNETFCDSLAFQGTMKVLEDGREVENITGSGHHGPDWVGVASIRSGKGYKVAGQPVLQRLI